MIFVASLAIGLAAGVLGGIFGLGGGIIIVPALVSVGMSQRQAGATSLMAMLLPVGIFGVIEYAKHGDVQWVQGGLVALGLLVGIFIGAKFGVQVSDAVLQRSFGVLLLAVGLKFILFPK
jgi:uncharacterized membrane protein YfcA